MTFLIEKGLHWLTLFDDVYSVENWDVWAKRGDRTALSFDVIHPDLRNTVNFKEYDLNCDVLSHELEIGSEISGFTKIYRTKVLAEYPINGFREIITSSQGSRFYLHTCSEEWQPELGWFFVKDVIKIYREEVGIDFVRTIVDTKNEIIPKQIYGGEVILTPIYEKKGIMTIGIEIKFEPTFARYRRYETLAGKKNIKNVHFVAALDFIKAQDYRKGLSDAGHSEGLSI